MSARLIRNGAAFAPLAYHVPEGAAVPASSPPAASGGVTRFVPPAAADISHVARTPARTHARDAQPSQKQPQPQPQADDNAINQRAEAERLLAEARARVAGIEREARERGLAEARARADEEVARAVEPLREQLARTIQEVAALRGQVVARAERDLVKLALEIAKRVVHREVTVDGDVALTLARVALARVHNRAQARLHLHPEDLAYVTARAEGLPGGSSVELVEDRAVGRGGCLVETEMGDIDVRIERQFAEIERSLLAL